MYFGGSGGVDMVGGFECWNVVLEEVYMINSMNLAIVS